MSFRPFRSLLLAALVACGEGSIEVLPGAEGDAGVPGQDASTPEAADASSLPDAAADAALEPGPDAASPPDAAGLDAGLDAGVDAGLDAGSPPRLDAGPPPGNDAGSPPGRDAGGAPSCGDGTCDQGETAGSCSSDCISQSVAITATVADGDDWTLPSWVTDSPHAGFVNRTEPIYGPQIKECQLGWLDISPAEGTYNFTCKKGVDLGTMLANATSGGYKVWVRFFASDTVHLPPWLKARYPSIQPLRYRWPDAPYRDIYGWPGVDVAGDFYPLWRTELETEWRKVMTALAARGFGSHPALDHVYVPGGWRWSEYSVKWVPEMQAAGFTAAQYRAWAMRHLQDYIDGFNGAAGKIVFTGVGGTEWIEWTGNQTTFDEWKAVINDGPNGASGLAHDSIHALGCGARDGMTEAYNRYPAAPSWGRDLVAVGKYRYSVTDEAHPLVAGTRYFGTENEALDELGADTYHHNKLMQLVTLSLRMNHQHPGKEAIAGTALTTYVRKEMGKRPGEAPDAFAYLRQYAPHREIDVPDLTENVRNFERWLLQREVIPGGETQPTYRVTYPAAFSANGTGAFDALRTDLATNNRHVYFKLEPLFMSGGPHEVDVKVTWLDDVAGGSWRLEYLGAGGVLNQTQPVAKTGGNVWKTATFRVADFQAGLRRNLPDGMDLRLTAVSSDLSVQFVRVLRVQAP